MLEAGRVQNIMRPERCGVSFRLRVRHAPGWRLPNQKRDNAPTSAEEARLLYSAWPNENILALRRSEHRLCNPEAKDFLVLPERESVRCGIPLAAWHVPLRHPDRRGGEGEQTKKKLGLPPTKI